MSNDFQKKLDLYKEGKLNEIEIEEIEGEMEKFHAIMEYIQEDEKEFIEELKHQTPAENGEKKDHAKSLKRKVNKRIILTTTLSVLSILIVSIFLYSLTSKITTSLFGLDYKESYVEREKAVQIAQMFHPQYESNGSGVESYGFAQQNISVDLTNTVGNTLINKTELNVNYRFSNPVRTATTTDHLTLLPMENFSFFQPHESNPIAGFEVLENAPQGTIAKVLMEFSDAITAQQIKENFSNQLSTVDITPIAAIGTEYVIANPSYYQFTPVYPYESSNAKQLEGNPEKQKQYENMDNKAHTDSFIGNLKLIKNNLRLLQVMYYDDMLEKTNMDTIISDVEKNGVKYVGMYISADSKELLKLKNSPLIHCLQVENIVVW